jgi:hypothetical protein
MIPTEEEKQAVGWTDMRKFCAWLAKAPPVIKLMATLYPPSVYRVRDPEGDILRAVPEEYYVDNEGNMRAHMIVNAAINPEHPRMLTHRITGVPLSKLEPVKWPPDARVH